MFLTTKSHFPFCDYDDIYCHRPLDNIEVMTQFQEDKDLHQSQPITPTQHSQIWLPILTLIDWLQLEVLVMPSY